MAVVMMALVSLIYVCNASPAFGAESSVDNGKQALAIAQEYVTEKYQHAFNDYNMIVVLYEDIWYVAYQPSALGDYSMGGGGPQVEIAQRTGEILQCSLQK